MSSALSLAFLIPSLGCGGAERVAQLLVRGFDARGHRVTLLTTTRKDDFYALPEGIERVRLDLTGRAPGRGGELLHLPGTLATLTGSLPRLKSALDAAGLAPGSFSGISCSL